MHGESPAEHGRCQIATVPSAYPLKALSYFIPSCELSCCTCECVFPRSSPPVPPSHMLSIRRQHCYSSCGPDESKGRSHRSTTDHGACASAPRFAHRNKACGILRPSRKPHALHPPRVHAVPVRLPSHKCGCSRHTHVYRGLPAHRDGAAATGRSTRVKRRQATRLLRVRRLQRIRHPTCCRRRMRTMRPIPQHPRDDTLRPDELLAAVMWLHFIRRVSSLGSSTLRRIFHWLALCTLR